MAQLAPLQASRQLLRSGSTKWQIPLQKHFYLNRLQLLSSSSGGGGKMDAEVAKRHVPEPFKTSYTSRDAIIYALGVGASTTQPDDLRFIYEMHERFAVLPTFAVAAGIVANGRTIADWPGVRFDLQRVLHGEQYIEVFRPLPPDADVRCQCRVVDILDKGTGALILTNVETVDARTGLRYALQQFAAYQAGFGDFGGARTSPKEKKVEPVPKRAPDAVIEQQTSLEQAALYRLGGGDLNPLHIDAGFARIAGFKRPILHGLCSLGFSVRHVLRQYADSDVARFRAVKARFSKPVYPGQTLSTEMWKEGSRIHFQTKVKETDEAVLSSCYVDLKDGGPESISVQTSSNIQSTVQSAAVFAGIAERLKQQKEAVKKVNAVILYTIKQNGAEVANFTLDLKNGDGSVYEGKPKDGEKPATTVFVEDEDFIKIATGKMDPQQAFMTGKVKANGDIMLLLKLQGLMMGAPKPKQ